MKLQIFLCNYSFSQKAACRVGGTYLLALKVKQSAKQQLHLLMAFSFWFFFGKINENYSRKGTVDLFFPHQLEMMITTEHETEIADR